MLTKGGQKTTQIKVVRNYNNIDRIKEGNRERIIRLEGFRQNLHLFPLKKNSGIVTITASFPGRFSSAKSLLKAFCSYLVGIQDTWNCV